ncbi:hypothetical protein HK097_005658 [Rhizophlyctis rosea]|uniref:Uncharacterized protein n=1 Tax=Rhizophlyctis rosea TaxID=64517 RepID=A0AAD5SDB5_9FUNG|nr:hypothetical protein HK097_005658 [Rhizophlyctis rosea]
MWQQDLFSESGKLNLNTINARTSPSPSSNHDSHTTTASSHQSTTATCESSFTSLLTLPPAIVVELAKNKSEAELLLEVGQCGFKLDQLLLQDGERAYHGKILSDTIAAVTSISVQNPDYHIAQIKSKEHRAALPILEAALAKVARERSYLYSELRATSLELAHLSRLCTQYSEINTGIGNELRQANIAERMAEEKLVLADVQKALASRINHFILGDCTFDPNDKTTWESLTKQFRQRRSTNRSNSQVDISAISHVSETIELVQRDTKRKRTHASDRSGANDSVLVEETNHSPNRSTLTPLNPAAGLTPSPLRGDNKQRWQCETPNRSSGSNGNFRSIESPQILRQRTGMDVGRKEDVKGGTDAEIITSTPNDNAASPERLQQLDSLLGLSGIPPGEGGHDAGNSQATEEAKVSGVMEMEVEMQSMGASQFTESQGDAQWDDRRGDGMHEDGDEDVMDQYGTEEEGPEVGVAADMSSASLAEDADDELEESLSQADDEEREYDEDDGGPDDMLHRPEKVNGDLGVTVEGQDGSNIGGKENQNEVVDSPELGGGHCSASLDLGMDGSSPDNRPRATPLRNNSQNVGGDAEERSSGSGKSGNVPESPMFFTCGEESGSLGHQSRTASQTIESS